MNRRLLWVLMFGTIVVIQGCAAGGSGSGGGANIPADNSGNGVTNRNFGNPVRATTFGNAGRMGSVYEANLEGPGSRDQVVAGRQSAGQSGSELSVLSWSGNNLVNNTAKWFPGGTNRITGTEPSLQFADMFNTGRTDMVVGAGFDAPNPGNSYVFQNVGGSFRRVEIQSKAWGHDVTVYDLNRDGFKDVIITDYGPNTTFAINNGVNGFTSLLQRNPNAGIFTASSIAAGDFLGNGSVTLVATDMGAGSNRTVLASLTMVPGGVDTTIIGDLPGSRFNLPKWANSGFGVPGRRGHDVRAINYDFNNDGKQDVIVMSRPWKTNGSWPNFSEIQFLKNNGGGSFSDVTDSTVSGYNTSTPVSYNPRFVDLNGDGQTDILLPAQGTTQLLLRSGNTYVAAYQQVFDEFKQAAASAGAGGANGNVVTLVNAPNGKTYLMSVNLGGVAYLSELGGGTASANGAAKLVSTAWPWMNPAQVAAVVQRTSSTYAGYTVLDTEKLMSPYGGLTVSNGRATMPLYGGLSGVNIGDLNTVAVDGLGRTFSVDLQPLNRSTLNSFQRNTQHVDQYEIKSHAEYLVNGPVTNYGNFRVGVDSASNSVNPLSYNNGSLAPMSNQYTLGVPSYYRKGNWNVGAQFTNLANNPFLAMSGAFGFVNNAAVLDNVVSYRHPSGFSATGSLMHITTKINPGIITNVSNMVGTWGEVGYRHTDWRKIGDVGFYTGVKPHLLYGNVTANLPTGVDNNTGNVVFSKRNVGVQSNITPYVRALYNQKIDAKTTYRLSGTYMVNGQYRVMHELRFDFN
jgi:hypothetical protein